MNDFEICNQVCVEMTDIYNKLYYSKRVPYRITEVFTNVIVQVQRGQVNQWINIRWVMSQFIE